ncbi:MAG: hypothetical protein IPM21_08015 [Acidobacteria bacterium]|nr:hypothetical protein [Acidobacteriota bacterium]
MKRKHSITFLQRAFGLFVVLGLVGTMLACGDAALKGGGASATEAYKKLYEAVKSKNTEAIKSNMSKKTLEFAEMVAARNNTPIEKVFENGFTATTMADSLPEIRDERTGDEFAAVEVWNGRDNKWEDIGFVNEDGVWKLAVGEMFGGTFKSPGKGRDQREKEAANAVGNTMVPGMPNANVNMNMNVTPVVPKPATNVK